MVGTAAEAYFTANKSKLQFDYEFHTSDCVEELKARQVTCRFDGELMQI
jgi:hypothetical protein